MARFNEDNTIEKMAIDALSARGWKYIEPESLLRQFDDVMVESMVKDALIRLNPIIAEDPSRADEVIYKLRALMQSATTQNLVTTNERFKKLVFEENSFPFGKNGKSVSVRFFGTTVDGDLDKNEYVVTNQWVFPQEKGGWRLDLVLLVNGFPLVIGEFKTSVRESVTWIDGASDIADYQKSIPQMFASNAIVFATEGKRFRYAGVGTPIDKWGPWHTSSQRGEGAMTDVKRSLTEMLTPANVMDIFQFFTLFTTDDKFRKIKKVCRYQQFEGANAIVDRVRKGYPKKGLIWHFQGSGKSLLMVFAAQKLRMMADLKNPTVIIVDDRINLESQITADFNAADIPNLRNVADKNDLKQLLENDTRKILITTIFKFGDVDRVLNERDNIVLLVDEAHRTQEGNLGEKMRLALPNAFFFGLTGTPINHIDKNTFRTFGAEEDKSGYMSRYSYSDGVRDKAIVPLYYEAVPVKLHVNQDLIDEAFAALTEGLTDAERAEITHRVRMEAIVKSPDRVRAVCKHIASHFTTKVATEGLKGMVVTYDRESCLLYKAELDQLLGSDATTVVIDTNDDKAGKYRAFRRNGDQEEKLRKRFCNPEDPLQLVIVTAKWLTGFDAPIMQTMYLDKPMKEHTLVQAICRTNRTYGDKKPYGLIVDYMGLFDDVAKYMNFDLVEMQTVVKNIDEVKEKLPELIGKCLYHFIELGDERPEPDWRGLTAAQQCIPTNKDKDAFGADYRVLSRAWEALSPDPVLQPYRKDYIWLSQVYQSVKPVDNRGKLIWASLGPKTMELVHENVTVAEVYPSNEMIEIDPNRIEEYIRQHHYTIDDAVRIVEIDLIARIRNHDKDKKFIRLGERLEDLRVRHEAGLVESVDFLKELLEMAREARAAEIEVVPEEEEDKGKAALTELFQGIKNEDTPIIVENIVNDIDEMVRVTRFDGWTATQAGRQAVRQELNKLIWVRYKIKDKELIDKAYRYVEMYY